jgi:hypothetical protein
MRALIAVLAGIVIFGFGLGVIRGFAGPRGSKTLELEAIKPLPEGVRILYWCETCGKEVLLLREGTPTPPRHCGESMTRREELLHG